MAKLIALAVFACVVSAALATNVQMSSFMIPQSSSNSTSNSTVQNEVYAAAAYFTYDSNSKVLFPTFVWSNASNDDIQELAVFGANASQPLFLLSSGQPPNVLLNTNAAFGPLSKEQEDALVSGKWSCVMSLTNGDKLKGDLVVDILQLFSAKLEKHGSNDTNSTSSPSPSDVTSVCSFIYSNITSQLQPIRFFASGVSFDAIQSLALVDTLAPETDEPVFSVEKGSSDLFLFTGNVANLSQIFNLSPWDSAKLYENRLACQLKTNEGTWQAPLQFVQKECGFNAHLTSLTANTTRDGLAITYFNNVTQELFIQFIDSRIPRQNVTGVQLIQGQASNGNSNAPILFNWDSRNNIFNSTVPIAQYVEFNQTTQQALFSQGVGALILTTAQPRGELGGQLQPPQVLEFVAFLNASNVNSTSGSNTSNFTGIVYAIYDQVSHVIIVETFRTDVPQNQVTLAGLRSGASGQNGPDAAILSVGLAPNVTIPSDQAFFLFPDENDALLRGDMYAFVSTAGNDNGVIRGQLQQVPQTSGQKGQANLSTQKNFLDEFENIKRVLLVSTNEYFPVCG